MNVSKRNLRLYQGLYWANQSLLHAIDVLQDAKPSASSPLDDQLRRTQNMIEETRELMNRVLSEWIQSDQ
jgi:hypothetical protein